MTAAYPRGCGATRSAGALGQAAPGPGPWRLLAQRAAWSPADGVVVVADVHLGKAASFRALGVPIPAGTTQANLAALDHLLRLTGAPTLVFLGDLYHAAAAQGEGLQAALAAWRARHAAVRMVLVEGNHDRHAGRPAAPLGIEVVAEGFALAGMRMCHHPCLIAGQMVMAGHLHPGVRLAGRGRDRLRLPCFWWRPGCLVLPAFGDFTGAVVVAPGPGDRIVAVGADAVFDVPVRGGGRVSA